MDIHGYGTFLEEKARQTARRKARKASIDVENWMSTIPDSYPVSAITIPGTHDSAAYDSIWPFVKTQDMDILQQLNAGIRYFDLRCGMRNNVLEMVHGRALLGRTLESVLETLYSWLDTHPREGLIVQIKQDRAAEESDVPFETAARDVMESKPHLWRVFPTTPTVKELRGRIQLFRRFTASPTFGIDVAEWQDNPESPFMIQTLAGVQLVIQDHYNATDPAPLNTFIARKGGDVSELLAQAASDKDLGRWYINFASAYQLNWFYQYTAHQVALGAYFDFVWVEGINARLSQTLWEKSKTEKKRRRYGIVVMDFPEQPSEKLIRRVIESNLEEPRKKRFHPINLVALLLLLVFIGGIILRLVHGPEKRYFCPPFLPSCPLYGDS